MVTLSNGTEVTCRAIVLALGVATRELDVPGIDKVTGAGVYYGAALTEAPNYAGLPMFVVGGANSAGQAAMMLSKYAGKVTVLVRGETLEAGMSQYLIDQIQATSNIDVRLNTEVIRVAGDGHLQEITMHNRADDTQETREAAGLFIFIGARPHSDFVQNVVAQDRRGFILTGPDLLIDGAWQGSWALERDPYLLETSVPGIFAAGDVRANVIRRVASAVGQGAVAVSFIHKYLETA